MQQLLRKLFFIRLTTELAAKCAVIFLLYKKWLGLYSLLFLPLVFLWLPSIKKIALEFDRKFKAKERFASTLLELPDEKREVIEAQASPLITSRFDLRSFLNLLVIAFCLVLVFKKDPFIQKIDALLDDPSVDKKEELIAIKEALISDGLGSDKLDIVLRQIEEEEPQKQEDSKEQEKEEEDKSEDKKEGEQKEQQGGEKSDSKSEEEGRGQGDTEKKEGKGGKSEESSKEGEDSGEQKSDKGGESNQSDKKDEGEGSKLIEEIKKEHQEKKGEQQSNSESEQKGEESKQKSETKDKEKKDSKGEGQSQGQPEKKSGEKGKEDKKEKKGDPGQQKGEKEGDKGEEREGESQNKQSGGNSGEGPKEGESEEGSPGDLKFEEVSIPGQDEKLDESQVTDETKASDNKDEAKYKREMEEMLNLKSDPALERKKQYIPKEYEEYFR